ncbi:hypothetical protein SteCoe_12561 [Stentor coeruleus]|uniref:Uncharacterized protein n=1 Tax=Stentor coeruleus TaxID=5963 RepID=A0A1R2CAG3_9CILI|nr:hypothetical protein SteCoe_12561 [Stentor coeruleus]
MDRDRIFAVLRHGQRADYAIPDRPYLVRDDPPLTERGMRQAEIAANKIYEVIGDIDDIYLISSPFLRCIETASKIASIKGIPIHIDERFCETLLKKYFDSDILEILNLNTKITELENELGVKIIHNPGENRPAYPENSDESYARVIGAWESVKEEHKEHKCIIIVSHCYIINKLSKHWGCKRNMINDKGLCKLAVVKYNEEYEFLFEPSSEYCKVD